VKKNKKNRGKRHYSSRYFGTKKRPRLSVHKTHKHIYAQIIDDTTANTLVSASDMELKKSKKNSDRIKTAKAVGEQLAKKAAKKKIKTVVFDKGRFKYHGRAKALAEGARKGGLKF
jgi:large subunit ribosomal protein L18